MHWLKLTKVMKEPKSFPDQSAYDTNEEHSPRSLPLALVWSWLPSLSALWLPFWFQQRRRTMAGGSGRGGYPGLERQNGTTQNPHRTFLQTNTAQHTPSVTLCLCILLKHQLSWDLKSWRNKTSQKDIQCSQVLIKNNAEIGRVYFPSRFTF